MGQALTFITFDGEAVLDILFCVESNAMHTRWKALEGSRNYMDQSFVVKSKEQSRVRYL